MKRFLHLYLKQLSEILGVLFFICCLAAFTLGFGATVVASAWLGHAIWPPLAIPFAIMVFAFPFTLADYANAWT